jgi:hypothetical protein
MNWERPAQSPVGLVENIFGISLSAVSCRDHGEDWYGYQVSSLLAQSVSTGVDNLQIGQAFFLQSRTRRGQDTH